MVRRTGDASPLSPAVVTPLILTEFCKMQNSLCVQVLYSPILVALLHGTRAVAISQPLWCGTRNGITKLSQRVPPIFGWAAITLGIGPHSSLSYYNTGQLLTNDRLATVQFSTLLWPPTVMGRPLYFAAVVLQNFVGLYLRN